MGPPISAGSKQIAAAAAVPQAPAPAPAPAPALLQSPAGSDNLKDPSVDPGNVQQVKIRMETCCSCNSKFKHGTEIYKDTSHCWHRTGQHQPDPTSSQYRCPNSTSSCPQFPIFFKSVCQCVYCCLQSS
ncbi:uncharacterized protein LOC130540320 isoform X1 [Takifugu flavidus]|uniref:uncharacterized protein LOC130540320 isoform X1 n=1 Tax=Takifugu flavidus TaxID=433684 RepID=UPI002544CEE2|nr:uncharacterized protein LOC130540320 isoform X1 [Takifugu flavidus]XP_056915361.1 uncharacterized protein LOC130540320 isoform X1 [Takifugu flavidus]